jgi:hypothetical protein
MATAEGLQRAIEGPSEAEFRERFGAEEACRTALVAVRWHEGLTRPACGGRGLCEPKARKVFRRDRRKRQARLTAGAVFQGAELPLAARFAAVHHLTQGEGGIGAIELGRRLGVEQGTAWPMRRGLTRAMAAREAGKPRPMATGAGKKAAGWTPFRRVRATPGNVETALAGTRHQVSAKHAPSCLTSFACRLDRRFRLDSIVERLARAAVRAAVRASRVVSAVVFAG